MSATIHKAPIYSVDPYYGRTNARRAARTPTVFGVQHNDSIEWWQRRADAVAAAEWLNRNEWDGSSDLEITLLQSGVDLKGKWVGSTDSN